MPIVTLHDKKYENGTKLNKDTIDASVADRVALLKPAIPGQPVIYWEAQGKDRMCALHCLNTLLQGPIFSEADLSTVALRLDETERTLLSKESADVGCNPDVIELLQGGSSNVADDGYFSFVVLEECLRTREILCFPSTSLAMRGVLEHPTNEEAFLCNRQEHWFCLRKVHSTWYNLDSLKPAPMRLGEIFLSEFLRDLVYRKYSVFVVRCTKPTMSLPTPNLFEYGEKRLLNKNQFYLSNAQIEQLLQMDNDEEKKALLVAQQVGTTETKTADLGDAHTIEKNFLGLGRRLDGRNLNDAAFVQENLDETDPALIEAVALSLQEFYESLPLPPPEPSDSDASKNVITLQVRLPNQSRLLRRFWKTDRLESIFHWLEREQIADITIGQTPYMLMSFYPRRELCRYNRNTVCIRQMLEDNDNIKIIQGDEAMNMELQLLFTSEKEQLVMQILYNKE